jgi:hypothetical protein
MKRTTHFGKNECSYALAQTRLVNMAHDEFLRQIHLMVPGDVLLKCNVRERNPDFVFIVTNGKRWCAYDVLYDVPLCADGDLKYEFLWLVQTQDMLRYITLLTGEDGIDDAAANIVAVYDGLSPAAQEIWKMCYWPAYASTNRRVKDSGTYGCNDPITDEDMGRRGRLPPPLAARCHRYCPKCRTIDTTGTIRCGGCMPRGCDHASKCATCDPPPEGAFGYRYCQECRVVDKSEKLKCSCETEATCRHPMVCSTCWLGKRRRMAE